MPAKSSGVQTMQNIAEFGNKHKELLALWCLSLRIYAKKNTAVAIIFACIYLIYAYFFD